MKKAILILILFSVFAPCAYCTEIFGKVIKVYDGDTIRIETVFGEKYKIRLAGIDAPESTQEFGAESSLFLSEMIHGKYVLVRMKSIDIYGRAVGEVFIREGERTLNISAVMIQNGMAWFYSDYSSSDEMKSLERKAREEKTGLWNSPNPMKPSEFRKMQK